MYGRNISNRPHKSSLQFRRLVPGRCQHCSVQFFYKATGRPRKFCTPACQQRDFRCFGGEGSGRNESTQKSAALSKAFRPDFADRPPAEVLGNGRRWPPTGSIDRELLREIIATEIPEQRNQPPVEIPDSDYWRIPDDLSIPQFLKRGPVS
jgi:hypothetical protein